MGREIPHMPEENMQNLHRKVSGGIQTKLLHHRAEKITADLINQNQLKRFVYIRADSMWNMNFSSFGIFLPLLWLMRLNAPSVTSSQLQRADRAKSWVMTHPFSSKKRNDLTGGKWNEEHFSFFQLILSWCPGAVNYWPQLLWKVLSVAAVWCSTWPACVSEAGCCWLNASVLRHVWQDK